MKKFFILLLVLLLNPVLRADEGMWIPILLEKYNIADMRAKGFRLTADDIYSVNKASMKDAIVIFGRGCTGELISDEGLLITNHHCGYGQIQRHSSLEHDYLTNGFWAMSREEELPNPDLTVTFLVSMEDVTDRVLDGVDDSMSEAERSRLVDKNIATITAEAVAGTHYEAEVESFYLGNQYFLFVNEVFTDVRLVGAPPSAIGKFGGDTDNWMWPRHTGDFSLFRIYAGSDGKPAKYAKDNVPLKPKYHFPISLAGVDKGDFTMVFGYPGSTTRYMPAVAVEQVQEVTDPTCIMIRGHKLDIINAAMNSDPLVRIQYSAKAAGIANGWKKWMGEIKGLKRLQAVNAKRHFEANFASWANAPANKAQHYNDILPAYEQVYQELNKYSKGMIFINEAGIGGCDALQLTLRLRPELAQLKSADSDMLATIKEAASAKAAAMFKDFDKNTDKKLFAEMFKLYVENMPTEFLPDVYADFVKITKKSHDKYADYADYCYDKSVFADKQRFEDFFNNLTGKSYKAIAADPIYRLMSGYLKIYVNDIVPPLKAAYRQIDSLDRRYMRAQMDFQPQHRFYPDANFTLRVTYGNVDGYNPADGVTYRHFTTLDGIMEKNNPDIYDYAVPERLKLLHQNRDYGRYADKDGSMHVSFIATNHTTGGNSGSPVINANGQLIGINFDRNWEGTMSDIMYDPNMCRNISLDIRYALFIIDKYAGATHLINEMDIRM